MGKINTLIKKKRNLWRAKPIPVFYLKRMNRFIEGVEKCDEKELKNADLGKRKQAHLKMFQRFKARTLRGKDLPWAKELTEYRKNNDIWAESEEEESEQDKQEEEVAGKDDEFGADDFGDDDFGDGDFGDDDFEDGDFDDNDFDFDAAESDSMSDSDDGEQTKGRKITMFNREFWLKAAYQPAWMKEKKVDNKKKIRDERQKKRAKEKLKAKTDKKDIKERVWDAKRVRKEVTKILEAKGSVDRSDRKRFIEQLKVTDQHCDRVQWKMLIKLLIIDNFLDLYSSPWCLKRGAWNDVVKYLTELLELLTEYPRYRLHIRGLRKLELNAEEKEKMKAAESSKNVEKGISQTTFAHGLDEAEAMLDRKEVEEDTDEVQGLSTDYWWLRGNLNAVCIRLHDDLILAFKKSDISNEDYEARVEDKKALAELCTKCQTYVREVTKHKMHELMFQHLLVKLMYETYDPAYDALSGKDNSTYEPFVVKRDSQMSIVCLEIFKTVDTLDGYGLGAVDENEHHEFETNRLKIKWETMLYLVHYFALHHKFLLARDLLAASGLGKETNISKSEIYMQILYNRTVARLAIAAFVHEDYNTSMTLLQRLYITGKIKELLAQGVKQDLRWKHNKTPEEIAQEQQEKQRMVPQHTFIDQDLLESVHFISSLFFEMKAILLSRGEESRAINWSFRRQWDYRQKREFLAPPENTRDTILEAGAQMLKGAWRTCLDHLLSLKCWEQFEYADQVKEQVMKKAKEECLRCYLISSSKHFSDLRLDVLATKYEISNEEVIKLCSQFIVAQDIRASIDLIGQYLVIHEPLPTQFENSASTFHHKLSSFMGSIVEAGEMFGVKQQHHREKYKKSESKQPSKSSGGNWRN